MKSNNILNRFTNETFDFKIYKLPDISFYLTSVSLPGLTMNPIEVGRPTMTIPMEGNAPEFNELSISFYIDEFFKNWVAIYNWMLSFSYLVPFDNIYNKLNPNLIDKDVIKKEDDKQKQANKEMGIDVGYQRNYSDASLILYDNFKKPIINFRFINLFPVSVSDVNMDINNTNDYLILDCTFRYQYYLIEELRTNEDK